MKLIPLFNGTNAIVDDCDFERLAKEKWHQHNCGYAVRRPRGVKAIYMHREVIACPDGLEIDHINRDPLDNRRCNLRAVPHHVNLANRPKQKNNTTGFKGVFLDKRAKNHQKKWYVIKRVNKKVHCLGSFYTAEEASAAYESF